MPRLAPTLAVTSALLALTLAGCGSGTQNASDAADPAASTAASPSGPAPSASASPTPAPSAEASPSAPGSSSASASESFQPLPAYVDPVPAALRASLYQQGSVPAGWADWVTPIPKRPQTAERVDVPVDRRLPACGKEVAPGFGSDRRTAGFAARLLADGGFIVARQLTVYHDEAAAKAAMREIAGHLPRCTVYDGKPVTGAVSYPLVDAGELDIPQHDQTLAGETALSTGSGPGAIWWTVLSRENNAVALTRVVDPRGEVAADGTPNDSIPLRQAVLRQARVSAQALDTFR